MVQIFMNQTLQTMSFKTPNLSNIPTYPAKNNSIPLCTTGEKPTDWLIFAVLLSGKLLTYINFLLIETKLHQFNKFLFIVVQIRKHLDFFWPHCVPLHRENPTDWLILAVLFSQGIITKEYQKRSKNSAYV